MVAWVILEAKEMRRFRAQLILLFAVLMLAHAQCVLACAVVECRQASVPPCHRHHPTKSPDRCNQDQFVASVQAPVLNLAPCAMAAIPTAEVAIVPAELGPALVPPLSPPPLAGVAVLTPLRV
jgi:hypothetical protein